MATSLGNNILNIGFLNIFGLFGKDRFVPELLENFEVFGFAETSISKSTLMQSHDPRNRFQSFQTYYSCCSTHTKGVALSVKNDVQVLRHSESWSLPDNLHGRFVACEIVFVSNNPRFKHGLKAWMIVIYAPTSSADASTVRSFYASLSNVLRTQSIAENIYIMGDWNGCLRTRDDQIKIPNRPVRLTPSDSNLQNFFRTQRLSYPVNCMTANFNIREHFTHESHYTEIASGERVDFYRVIDYIFVSSQTGIIDYAVDSFYDLMTNSNNLLQGSIYVDHNVVSIKVDLDTLCQGRLLESCEPFCPPKSKMPPKNGNTKADEENRQRLGQATIAAAKQIPTHLQHTFLAPELTTTHHSQLAGQCNELASSLQTAIGDSMTTPFLLPTRQSSKSKRQHVNPYLKRRLQGVTYINKCIKYLHLLHDHLSSRAAPLSEYRKGFIINALQNSPTEVVDPPLLTVDINDLHDRNVIETWIALAKTKRKGLWKDIRTEEGRLKTESREKYSKALRKEEYLCSKKYRSMVYGKKQSSLAVVTLVSEDGSLEFTPDGIMESSRAYWLKLGTPLDAEAQADLSKPWIDNPLYAEIRNRIADAGPESVRSKLDMATLRYIIHHAKRSSAPGLDNIRYETLQTLLWEDDDEEVNEARNNLLTLMLSLINTILETGKFPNQLKRGEIIAIYKKGDPRQLQNYRGITLLSVLYKLVTCVLAHRLLNLCERAGAISIAQAGARRDYTAPNRLATFQNILSNAHRAGKPVFILLTDIAKAFDKVAFEGFADSLKCLGLDDALGSILADLQADFECCARTFYGRTSFFHIGVGCKQGDVPSPLRFNLFLDMFIRQLEHKQLGYKFVFKHLPKSLSRDDIKFLQQDALENHYIIIALLGYMDDCLFFGEDHDQLVEIAGLFDEFLHAYGMSVNAPKCLQICMVPGDPDYVPPPISMRHIDGSLKEVACLKASDTFTYLGVACSLELNRWEAQHSAVELSFEEARNNVHFSSASAVGAVKLLNQDVFSTLIYSMGPVMYPKKFRHKLQSAACQTLKRRGHFQSTVPFESFSMPQSVNGLGLHNIHVLYQAEKAKFLRNVIRTPDTLCRLTSLENIDSLHRGFQYRKSVLNPGFARISPQHSSWAQYPSFYQEGHEALHEMAWSIHVNGSCSGLGDVSIQEFITPFLPAVSHLRYLDELEQSGFKYMAQLVPSLFDRTLTPHSLPPIDSLHHRNLLQQREVIFDESTSLGLALRECTTLSGPQCGVAARAVKAALEDWVWKSSWQDFKSLPTRSVCFFPKGVSDCSTIASDGSFKDDVAAFGVKCNSHAFSSTLPGLQTIQRAELFGILAAIYVTSVHKSVTVVTDSYSSKSIIDTIWSQQSMPRQHCSPANRSILLQIMGLLKERTSFGCTTEFLWIPSHTEGNEDKLEYLLNAAADRLANQARQAAHPPHVSECMDYVERFHFKDSSGCIIESDVSHRFKKFFAALHQAKAIKSALRKKPSSSLSYFQDNVPDVSKTLSNLQTAATNKGKTSRNSVFLFKLLTNSLPTMSLQFKLNESRFPLLYPSKSCVLCTTQAHESPFHALCSCPKTITHRRNAFIAFENKVRSKVPSFFNSPLPESFFEFFTAEDNYKRGLLASKFHLVFLDKRRVTLSKEDFSALRNLLQYELLRCFHTIWEERNKIVNQISWSFGSRVKAIYGVRKMEFLDALNNPDCCPRLVPLDLNWVGQQQRSPIRRRRRLTLATLGPVTLGQA